MGRFDYLLAFGRVMASTLSGAKKALLVNISSIGEGDDPDEGETATGEVMYGQLGVVARPKPPDADGAMEVVSARTEDGQQPFGARDLRLNAQVNPAEGEVDVVGYGGAFISLKENEDPIGGRQGANVVIYAPNGDRSKASAISIDTTTANSHLALMHESGASITITKDGNVVLASPNGQNTIVVSDSGVALSGAVSVSGAMVVGNQATAVPVLLAPLPGVPSAVFMASVDP